MKHVGLKNHFNKDTLLYTHSIHEYGRSRLLTFDLDLMNGKKFGGTDKNKCELHDEYNL